MYQSTYGSGNEDPPSLSVRRAHWDKRSALYSDDVRQTPVRAETLHVLLELIPSNVASALDVGTGTGVTVLAISDKVPGIDIVASDLSSGILQHVRSQQGSERISWVMAYSAQLPFRDDFVDIVTSTFMLRHFPRPEQLAVLRELWRVAAPYGQIMLADQVLPAANIDKDDMNDRVLDLFLRSSPARRRSRQSSSIRRVAVDSQGAVTRPDHIPPQQRTIISHGDLALAVQHRSHSMS